MEGRLFRTISVSEFPLVQILQQQKTHTRNFFLSITPAQVYPAVRTIKMFSAPVTKFWPKVPLQKRVIATKLNSRQKCVNQVNLI